MHLTKEGMTEVTADAPELAAIIGGTRASPVYISAEFQLRDYIRIRSYECNFLYVFVCIRFARAAARGPARSSQPGHIEFGTGNWKFWVLLDGDRNRPMESPVEKYAYVPETPENSRMT
jgi:hypothetical protein